jgi:hypothetical protein
MPYADKAKRNARQRAKYKKDREKVLAYNKAWRDAHPECAEKYYKENREWILKKKKIPSVAAQRRRNVRKRYDADPEKFLAINKAWRASHPEWKDPNRKVRAARHRLKKKEREFREYLSKMKYYRAHIDKYKNYYKTHRDQERARSRKYQQDHKEERVIANHRRYIRKKKGRPGRPKKLKQDIGRRPIVPSI